ncbi:MAG: hypothetical protein WBA13_13630 [Microcoleaceae cyanobacterium]
MDNSLFDKVFRDSEGNIVIAQPPNPPLIAGIVATLLKFVITSGNIYIASDAIAFGALFTWGWLELSDGVNYFRRGLGLLTLIFLVYSKIST